MEEEEDIELGDSPEEPTAPELKASHHSEPLTTMVDSTEEPTTQPLLTDLPPPLSGARIGRLEVAKGDASVDLIPSHHQ